MSARDEAAGELGSLRLTDIAASEGVAVGPAFVHVTGELKPKREYVVEGAVEAEMERFRRAVEVVVVGQLSEMGEWLGESRR